MFLIRPFILQNSLTGLPLILRISYYIIKRARAAYKRSNFPANNSAFSELRAKCKRLSKIDYQSYISSSEKMLLHNPSAFWKFTKELNQNNTIPCTLRLDNETADPPT